MRHPAIPLVLNDKGLSDLNQNPTEVDQQLETGVVHRGADNIKITNEGTDKSMLAVDGGTLVKQEPLDQDCTETCHNVYDSHLDVHKQEPINESSEMEYYCLVDPLVDTPATITNFSVGNVKTHIKLEPFHSEVSLLSDCALTQATCSAKDRATPEDAKTGEASSVQQNYFSSRIQQTLYKLLATDSREASSAGSAPRGSVVRRGDARSRREPLSCEHCPYTTGHKYSFMRHMRAHTGEKPFSCNNCDYKFSTSSALKAHMRTHSREKPFSCNNCDYKCFTSTALKDHMRTHTDEKPYACEYCDYKCSTASSLKTHMRVHTGERPNGLNMPRKNTVLRTQARKMVYDVHCFLKRESNDLIDSLKQIKSEIEDATSFLLKHSDSSTVNLSQIKQAAEVIKAGNMKLNGLISDLGKIQKRTAEATNTSISTVRKISTQANSSDSITAFKTPGKKRSRTKPVTDIDSFDQGVIKRSIHNFHKTNNELPTVGKLKRKLEEDINFKGSEGSLRRIIKSLGFRWKNTENNRKVPIETSNIRLQRIEYLLKIKQYRQEGRPIVYTDESYVDSSHSKGLNKPISKGQRVVIVHAGSETGFIPNALLTFEAGTKSGDYHDSMNFEKYEKWLRTQLMPNLPPSAVVVVDNASYHNEQWDLAPSSHSNRADMQTWLTEKGIQYEETLLKPQLYNLIKANKERFKTFSTDRILAEQGHRVLRLPPCHPDLNPIKMAWSDIRQYVGSKNVKWSVTKCTELIQEKVLLMGAWDWQNLCKKVKDIEEQYAQSDHVVDLVTEQFTIGVEEDSSDDSLGESDDDNAASADERSSSEPGPSTSKRPCRDTTDSD